MWINYWKILVDCYLVASQYSCFVEIDPFHTDNQLGHVSCFGLWNIRRRDASRGLISTYTLGLVLVECCLEPWATLGGGPIPLTVSYGQREMRRQPTDILASQLRCEQRSHIECYSHFIDQKYCLGCRIVSSNYCFKPLTFVWCSVQQVYC